jgi:predicted lipid-binding transport protein (Tim44 family)
MYTTVINVNYYWKKNIMKRFMLLLTLVFTSLSFLAVNAEAKRFGGGGSVGQQRTMAPQQAQKAPPANQAAAAPAAGNKWLGPLAGLAIGAGLGAMFASAGLGGAIGGILMALAAAALIVFLIAKFRKPQQPAMQYAAAGMSGTQVPDSPPPVQQNYSAGGTQTGSSVRNVPADFPAEAFLRSAKTSFIRLQAANDRHDLDDIREYTTPEMFAEISMQLRERANAAQKTDVLTINAELLEVVTENNQAIASVRMSGQLRENSGAPENFDEVWHVQKDTRDNQAVWLLSGIQQIA